MNNAQLMIRSRQDIWWGICTCVWFLLKPLGLSQYQHFKHGYNTSLKTWYLYHSKKGKKMPWADKIYIYVYIFPIFKYLHTVVYLYISDSRFVDKLIFFIALVLSVLKKNWYILTTLLQSSHTYLSAQMLHSSRQKTAPSRSASSVPI